MKKITHSSNRINIVQILSKLFLLGTLATVGFSADSLISSSKANAQTPETVDTNEIVKYSRALLSIEESRLQAFEEIKKISGGRQVPVIMCNKPKTITDLSTRKVRDIAKKYCQSSQNIVKKSGLSIKRFNNITVKLRSDESLKRQIHKQLIELQKKASPQ